MPRRFLLRFPSFPGFRGGLGEVVRPNGRILLRLGDKSFTPTEGGFREGKEAFATWAARVVSRSF